MDQQAWLSKNTCSLRGRTAAVTGATGGIGREICRGLLSLSADLVLICRDRKKTEALTLELQQEFPGCRILNLQADLSDIASVDRACKALADLPVDILIHNAGAYKIPRKTCSTGLNNVFEIDFLSPYYMTKKLLPLLEQRRGKVIVMGSVAHTYSRSDPGDPDFSTREPCHLVYGNAKRYLMFAFQQLMVEHPLVDFAIAHPGITYTNISAHYPPLIFALIRRPMQVIFMKPDRAARSVLYAACHRVAQGCWVGPRYFRVWGDPKVSPLKTCPEAEARTMYETAEQLCAPLLSDR